MTMSGEDLSLLAAFRAAQAKRLRLRAEYWRRKASDGNADAFNLRADEADRCADIIEGLKVEYAGPDEPDMKLAKGAK